MVKFGIIGCGMISRWHADALQRIEGARLIGATDFNRDARDAFAERYGIKAYSSVEVLLDEAEIQVICICTPSGLHAPHAIKAAGAKKHIIIEKPMALTLGECDAVIKACEDNHVKLAVISQLRFSPAVTMLKRAVEMNQLGKLLMGDIYMKFFRTQEYYNNSGWRGTWKMDGGGALMNQGIHGIDLLQYVMGPVKSVFAQARTMVRKIEVEDTAAAVVEFKNGALGVIVGTTSIYPGLPRRLEINGEKGTIILEEDSITVWNIEGQHKPADLVLGCSSSNASSNPAAFSLDGHIRQISDMAVAVENDRIPLVDMYEGRKPIEIIMAIYESARTGQQIAM